MDKKQRAERIIATLRWLIVISGLFIIFPQANSFITIGIAVLMICFNAMSLYATSNYDRFIRLGKKASALNLAADIFFATAIVMLSNDPKYPLRLYYWFPLIQMGYAVASNKKLFLGGFVVWLTCSMTIISQWNLGQRQSNLLIDCSLWTGATLIGVLISFLISKTRSQNDLAGERASYLQAILNCGMKLTTMRSIQEMAHFVIESVVQQTKAGGGELLLVGDETNQLQSEALFIASNQNVMDEASRLSYAEWVIGSGRELVIHQTKETIKGVLPEVQTDNQRAVIAVPLLWQAAGYDADSATLGVIIIWSELNDDFNSDALDILQIFSAIVGGAVINLRLYTNLQKSMLRTLQTLAKGLEARDEYTRGHSDRVAQIAALLAEKLNMPHESTEMLKNAALLHDIGKIGIPDAILRKPGKLTAEEWETMRRHPVVSEEICRPLGLSNEILMLIRHHHERLDSKGYPDALSSKEQPLMLRILTVADIFDAMRSRRPYRDRMTLDAINTELYKIAGRAVDPTIVDVLIRCVQSGETDSIYENHDRMIDLVMREATGDDASSSAA